MTAVEVVGLSADGVQLVLRVDDLTVEVPLADVRRAERRAERWAGGGGAVSPDEPLTPRSIQHRIRCGESAEDVAQSGGWPAEKVARFEGPPLAEREHHAAAARDSQVDGMRVEDLIAEYLRQPVEAVTWDSWLIDEGRWEVQARAAGQSVRLRWDPANRRVQAMDEPARRALRVMGVQEDLLTAVLRPVSGTQQGSGELGGDSDLPASAEPRRGRAQIPGWDDIAQQVTGRDRSQD